MKARTMQPEKNFHAFVPPTLLTEMEHAAQNQGITPDEFVSEAIKRQLRRQEFEETLAFGKRHAKERGLKPSDVAKAIAEVRAENKPRER